VVLEDVELVPDGSQVAEQVAGVGVLGHESEGPPLAAATDEDGDRPLDGARVVEGGGDGVVPTLVAGRVPAEHRPADPQGVLEPLHPLLDGRKGEPVAAMLVVVPGRPDPSTPFPPRSRPTW